MTPEQFDSLYSLLLQLSYRVEGVYYYSQALQVVVTGAVLYYLFWRRR